MLDRQLVEEVLRAARARGGAFAEVFVEERSSVAIRLDDGKIEELTTGLDRGAGVRVGRGTSFGYAFSNRLDRDALLEAAAAAAAALPEGSPGAVVDLRAVEPPVVHHAERPAGAVPDADKVVWLREVDDVARSHGPEVRQVVAIYGDSVQRVLIATSDGRWVEEVRPRVRLVAQVVAARDGTIQTGLHGPAGLAGVEFFDEHSPAETAEVAAKRAVTMLDARPAPAGEMTVVLGPGWPGILVHEAVGHGLEADFNRKGVSAFSGRIGEQVAGPLCTIVDDGTIPHRRGSLNVDDEGTPTEKNVLIEKGVLRGYLQDKLSSRLMRSPATGSGRRESYQSIPIPRMTNTYLMAGESDPEEILGSVARGVYCKSFGGGQVDITSGNFVFSASESYLIEGGRLGPPLRDATLIGNGPEALKWISMVGNDLQLDLGVGICGKEGQSVPVGVGIPTVKIDRMTVGGAA